MRRVAVFALVAIAAASDACINDRDTVASELRLAPDAARSLVGWFDRLPPRYYEMRIERLKAKPKLSAAEHDDLAAAYDRIGKPEEALKVMRVKAKLPLKGEDLYRLYANRGTFYAHSWLKNGAKASEIESLKAAERDIVTAVKIKPGAHFGRESTQLEVIRWMIDTKQNPKNSESLGFWLLSKETEDQRMGRHPDHIQGLVGLVSLGAAWESVDVAAALGHLLARDRRHQLAHFARLRIVELQRAGKKPFSKISTEADIRQSSMYGPGVTAKGGDPVPAYQMLREASDKRHDYLNRYVAGKLATGTHPDTDPAFWARWKEPTFLTVSEPAGTQLSRFANRNPGIIIGLVIFIPTALVIGIAVLIRSAIRRRARRLARSSIQA